MAESKAWERLRDSFEFGKPTNTQILERVQLLDEWARSKGFTPESARVQHEKTAQQTLALFIKEELEKIEKQSKTETSARTASWKLLEANFEPVVDGKPCDWKTQLYDPILKLKHKPLIEILHEIWPKFENELALTNPKKCVEELPSFWGNRPIAFWIARDSFTQFVLPAEQKRFEASFEIRRKLKPVST